MGLFLFLLANILGMILFPIGIIYAMILSFYRHHFSTGVRLADDKFLTLATSFDKYGNSVCAELLNATLIKKTSNHRFGDIEETISEVIGYNFLERTLTITGRVLNWILNVIDKNHSIESIDGD